MRFQTLFEGRWIFAAVLALGVIALGYQIYWLTAIAGLLLVFCLNFFTYQDRDDPTGDYVVVAAADDAVADNVEID